MTARQNPLFPIAVGVLLAPVAGILAPLFFISVARLQYEVLRRLAEGAGIVVQEKRALPFIVPLMHTAIYFVLAACAVAVFPVYPIYLFGSLLAISVVFAIVSAPLMLIVPAFLDQRARPTIEYTVRRWDGVPRSRRAFMVAARIAPVMLATAAFQATRWGSYPGQIVAVTMVYMAAWGALQWAIVDTYRRYSERAASTSGTGWRVLLPLVLGVGLAAPLGILVPAYATRSAPMAEMSRGPNANIYAGRAEYSVDFASARVAPALSGVEVRFADGARVEALYGWSCRSEEAPAIATVVSTHELQVFANACGRWHTFSVNSEAQRIDDSVEIRVLRRMGKPALTLLALALLFFSFALWRIVPALRKSKRIAAVVLRGEQTAGDQESIIEGILRLGDVKKLERRKGKLAGAGYIEVELEGDRFKLPLPRSVECAEGEYHDGARVSLIGVFSATTRGHRDAAIPWPKNAFVVAGEAESARESWLWRATRLARLSAMAAAIVVVLTYATYIAHFVG